MKSGTNLVEIIPLMEIVVVVQVVIEIEVLLMNLVVVLLSKLMQGFVEMIIYKTIVILIFI